MSDSTPQERKIIDGYKAEKIWRGEYKTTPEYEKFYDNDLHNGEVVRFENYIISDGINITGDVTLPNLHLVNTKMLDFKIDKTNTGFIRMDDCEIGNMHISRNSKLKQLKTNNSTIKNLQIRSSETGTIDTNSTEINSFYIQDSKTSYISFWNQLIDNFTLYNSNIKSLHITDNSRISLLNANFNTLFEGEISIYQSICYQIILYNVKINSHLKIFTNSDIGTIAIANNSLIDRVWIHGKVNIFRIQLFKAFIANILISGDVIVGELLLNDLDVNSESLNIHSSRIGLLDFKLIHAYKIWITTSSIINVLNIENTILQGGYVQVSDTSINEVNIVSFINHGTIIFNNIRPIIELTQFELNNDNNVIRHEQGEEKGKLKLEQVERESELNIINSDLGNTQFIGCDLASFKNFEFRNSKMASVFLADTLLPHKNNISTTDGANKNEQRRLALSQFKKVYEGQGDMVRAAEFRAEEMEVYREQLVKKEKFGTWLILSFSYYTSNYGQSIWLPLAALLVIHYWLFMWALGVGAFEFHYPKELIYHFFYLANPIRGYEFRNDWTIIIDILMRVWSSYMVYNFIRASRRFIK